MSSNNLLDWEDYQVDHLFLLIGENPLPNYVAATTLLREGGTVYLVYTEQTQSQKNSLKGVDGLGHARFLAAIGKIEDIDLARYESNAKEIRDRIQKWVKSTSGTVGLNYTGGTKAMAVHAYRAIQESKPDAVFSYLDSRSLKMYVDQGNNEPLRFAIPLQLSLEELFNLHDKYWLTKHPPRIDPYLPDLAEAIAELYKEAASGDTWRNKIVPELRKGRKSSELRSETEQVLNQYIDISGSEPIVTQKSKDEGVGNWEHFKKLFMGEGFWLESYVLNQINRISTGIGLQPEDSMMSFYVVDNKSQIGISNERCAKFELDIAFIKGYQLFAISCTVSSDKKVGKMKLFEAYLRARELGGDEARVALVCCSDEPWKIEEDMNRFGIPNPKIKVFGRQDLKNLGDAIADWIDLVEQEAKKYE